MSGGASVVGAAAGALRRLGRLEAATEAETPFGGRSVSYEPICDLWLALDEGAARERAAADGAPPEPAGAAEATARDHPLAARGQVLTLEGRRWRVLGVRRDGTGGMTLSLDLEG